MKPKDIEKISDASIAKLSDAICCVMRDLQDELGDARFKSELYAQFIALSAVYNTEFMNREREKTFGK